MLLSEVRSGRNPQAKLIVRKMKRLPQEFTLQGGSCFHEDYENRKGEVEKEKYTFRYIIC